MDLDVLKAYNGITALELLDSCKVDIILLDIKMPGLTGIEVADRINRNWPACKIVFLTGHSDFSYIYTANKKGNVTYLLKTEDDAEIVAAVSHAISALEASHKNDEYANQAIWGKRFSQHLIKREILRNILSGRLVSDITSRSRPQPKDFILDFTRPVFLVVGRIRWHSMTQHDLDLNAQTMMMEQIIDQALNHRFAIALTDVDAATVACFIQAWPQSEENHVSDFLYLKESLDDLVNQCAAAASCYIALSLYEHEISWSETGIACELMALKFLTNLQADTFSHSYGSVYRLDDNAATMKNGDNTLEPANLSENLSHYLNQGDKTAFLAELNRLENLLHGKSNMNHLPTIKIYQTITLIYMDFINRYQLQDKLSTKVQLRCLYVLEKFGSWKEAFRFLIELAEVLFQIIGKEEQNHNDKLVGEVKNYIRHHLDSDLSLTVISNLVNYNSSYLSRIFNQTANVSLSTYINNKRVEKAQELLRQTNENIHEISEKVGFDSSQYFSIVFKKSTGISPREYRSLYFSE